MAPRWRYLRGRVLLAGHDPETLSACDVLDIAEAVLADSIVMGQRDLGEVLARLTGVFDERFAGREQWGTLPHQREAAKAAEGMFAVRRDDPSTL